MMIEVGKPFTPGKTKYPEGAILEYAADGPILIIAFHNPSDAEIAGVKTGKLEMGFYEASPAIFIVVRIQGCGGWMDAPFSIRKYDGKHTFDWSEPIGDAHGLALHIVLIDAGTGVVRMQRLIGTSHQFAVGLREAILKQFEEPYSDHLFKSKVNEIYNSLSSDDIAKRAIGMFRLK